MAEEKFIKLVSGVLTEEVALSSSTGAPDAGKIPALDATGKFDMSMMPTGIGADTAAVLASEDLNAGDYVNIWSDAGAFKTRKADATTQGKIANGFILEGFLSGESATVYFRGTNTQVTGQVPGAVYLSATPGLGSATPPSSSGNVVQRIGTASSATSADFSLLPEVVLK